MTTETTTPYAAARHRSRGGVARFAGVTTVAVAAAGVVATLDPNEGGHYPTCPFLQVTGAYCPGCGSLRASHALLHGDLTTALDRNPLLVAALPLILFCWGMWGFRLAGRTSWSTTLIPPRWLWAMLGVILGFWILRNIPGWTLLAPA